MKREAFADSPTGSLIGDQLLRKSARGATERVTYHAFVPHPLPPDMPFSMELLGDLERATHSIGELSGLGRNLQNPALLTQPFIRREAVLSSRIEGTQADIKNVYEFEAAERARKPVSGLQLPPDVREVVNYIRAMSYAVGVINERPITLAFIRELHRILMENVRGEDKHPGEFRDEQVWIGDAGAGVNEATYVPSPPLHVIPLMEVLERYILDPSDQSPTLVRLAFIHYQFEAIHPFMDGNGRIGRLLMPLLLINHGLLSQPLLYLSAFFERHRETYYDLLLAVSQRGAWDEWVQFFLRGVYEQANDGLVRARRLTDLQEQWRREVLSIGRSGNLVKLVEALFYAPITTITEAASELGVTYQSARNHVHSLVDAGILSEIPETHPRQYMATAVIRAIADPVERPADNPGAH